MKHCHQAYGRFYKGPVSLFRVGVVEAVDEPSICEVSLRSLDGRMRALYLWT